MSGPEQDRDRHEDIGCLQAIEMFYAYVDGELGDAESVADFEHHLEHCRSCFSWKEFEGLLTERLREVTSERAPDALRRRLRILMDNF